jgi:hypothetical protein
VIERLESRIFAAANRMCLNFSFGRITPWKKLPPESIRSQDEVCPGRRKEPLPKTGTGLSNEMIAAVQRSVLISKAVSIDWQAHERTFQNP